MKAPPFEYHAVSSLEEAVSLLGEYGDEAKVLAGGQSLVPLLALRLARPEHVIDINRVPGLQGIEELAGLRVGPLVRQREAERSPTVAAANPLLAAALPFIG
ncbi:MAG TPA: FAD binding domain-containing protein, partial [Acidimicrobiia bacterium]|nr:FAD binding domain-containing protein [Acidimicrobiia bacterium]